MMDDRLARIMERGAAYNREWACRLVHLSLSDARAQPPSTSRDSSGCINFIEYIFGTKIKNIPFLEYLTMNSNVIQVERVKY